MTTQLREVTTGKVRVSTGGRGFLMPEKLYLALEKFLLDGRSGNLILHIDAGDVRKLKIEEYVAAK